MIENHAAMKWERLANEYLNERDECLALATKNRKTADALRARVAELEAKLLEVWSERSLTTETERDRYRAAMEEIHAAAVEVAIESRAMPEEDHLDTTWLINRTQAALNNEPMPE